MYPYHTAKGKNDLQNCIRTCCAARPVDVIHTSTIATSFPGSSLFLPHNEGIYSFRKSFIRRICAYKDSFWLWLNYSSTVWRSAHSLRRKKIRRTWYQQRRRADLYFSIGKITTLTTALMYSFRVWYVQCLDKRCSVPVLVLHVCVCCKPQSIVVCGLLAAIFE